MQKKINYYIKVSGYKISNWVRFSLFDRFSIFAFFPSSFHRLFFFSFFTYLYINSLRAYGNGVDLRRPWNMYWKIFVSYSVHDDAFFTFTLSMFNSFIILIKKKKNNELPHKFRYLNYINKSHRIGICLA